MKIRTAVTDYQNLFPEEYKQLLKVIEYDKQNLKTEFAELKETRGGGDWRMGFEVSERLFQMIYMKLNDEERDQFKEQKNQRWFMKEFPQFRITKEA